MNPPRTAALVPPLPTLPEYTIPPSLSVDATVSDPLTATHIPSRRNLLKGGSPSNPPNAAVIAPRRRRNLLDWVAPFNPLTGTNITTRRKLMRGVRPRRKSSLGVRLYPYPHLPTMLMKSLAVDRHASPGQSSQPRDRPCNGISLSQVNVSSLAASSVDNQSCVIIRKPLRVSKYYAYQFQPTSTIDAVTGRLQYSRPAISNLPASSFGRRCETLLQDAFGIETSTHLAWRAN